MATPRKRWFRFADKLAREPLTNDELATWARLLGHLNTRWARDGLDAAQACECVASPADLMQWAGCRSLARALRSLRSLAEHDPNAPWCSIEERGAYFLVRVPNFSKIQALTSDDGETLGQSSAPKSPSPYPRPASRSRVPEEKTQISPAARAGKRACPDELEPDQKAAIREWCRKKFPALEPELGAIWEAIRDWARAKGVLRPDWPATMRGAVRRRAGEIAEQQRRERLRQQGVPLAPRPRARELGPDDFRGREVSR